MGVKEDYGWGCPARSRAAAAAEAEAEAEAEARHPGVAGLEHGAVGTGHQLFEGEAGACWARRPAEGHLDRGPDELGRVGCTEVLHDAAGDGLALAAVEIECHGQEDSATDTGKDVDLAERHAQGPRHRLQGRVAGVVADLLVELLQVADIDEEDPDLGVLGVRDLQQRRPGAGQAAPVLKSGQLVGARQRQQLCTQFFHLTFDFDPAADVAQDAEEADRAVGVVQAAHRRLELDITPVAPSQAADADRGPRPVALCHHQLPARVLVVDEVVVGQRAELLGRPGEQGARGGIGRGDAPVGRREEHAVGGVFEHGPVGRGPYRVGVLHRQCRIPPPRACRATRSSLG